MLFGKPKTVQVSTKAELDAALAAGNTDSIVVVGGDNLLRYAEQKAGNDPDMIVQTETKTTTSLSKLTSIENKNIIASLNSDTSTISARPSANTNKVTMNFAVGSPPDISVMSMVKSRVRLAAAFMVAVVALAGSLTWYLHSPLRNPAENWRENPSTQSQVEHLPPTSLPLGHLHPNAGDFTAENAQRLIDGEQPTKPNGIAPPPGPVNPTIGETSPVVQPQISSESTTGRSSDLDISPPNRAPLPFHFLPLTAYLSSLSLEDNRNIPVMVWAAVALAAIVALYLIARQAIAGGQNVEISWKVTSKVEGKVIISRVQPHRQRQAKAA